MFGRPTDTQCRYPFDRQLFLIPSTDICPSSLRPTSIRPCGSVIFNQTGGTYIEQKSAECVFLGDCAGWWQIPRNLPRRRLPPFTVPSGWIRFAGRVYLHTASSLRREENTFLGDPLASGTLPKRVGFSAARFFAYGIQPCVHAKPTNTRSNVTTDLLFVSTSTSILRMSSSFTSTFSSHETRKKTSMDYDSNQKKVCVCTASVN